MSEFAYRESLDRAREETELASGGEDTKSSLSSFATPTASERVESQKQGLMRPSNSSNSRPEPSGGTAQGLGLSIMEGLEKQKAERKASKEKEEYSILNKGSRGSGYGTSTIPDSDTARRIRGKLIDRGMPEHVADAFVVNFQDESGLNSGINEHNPTVEGSRGGFGFYQLTGPRRVAYEAFAKARGVHPSDEDAQLDFSVWELNNTEKKARDAIYSTDKTSDAAVAILNKFLRPAKEHAIARAAKYRNL